MVRHSAVVLLGVVLLAGCQGSRPASDVPDVPTPTLAATPTASQPAAPAGNPSPSSSGAAWVVYQSPDGLQLIDPGTGSSRRLLPDGPVDALHADWSPDGARLAFAVDDPDGTRDIWIAAWDGSGATRLVDCRAPCRDADGPAWSPDGTRIAFVRIETVDGRNPGSAIQVADVPGGGIHSLASTTGAEYAVAPRWSPDGGAIVIQVDRYADDGDDTTKLAGQAIAVIDLDEESPTVRPIRSFESFSTYPDWHPREGHILFASGALDPLDPSGPPSNLFTIRSDGTASQQLTTQGATDDGLWMPAFRPDGSGILATLVHRPDGSLTLVSLGIDGSGPYALGRDRPLYGAHARQRPEP